MNVSAIRPSLVFGHENPMLTPVPAPAPVPKSQCNNVAISGGLALAFLGTTAVTGIAHAKVPHMISSVLTIGATLVHVESLAIRNNKKTDYYA